MEYMESRMQDRFEAFDRYTNALEEENARFAAALEKIASFSQTEGLLWWQLEARRALADRKPSSSTLTDEAKARRSTALDELGALDGELLG